MGWFSKKAKNSNKSALPANVQGKQKSAPATAETTAVHAGAASAIASALEAEAYPVGRCHIYYAAGQAGVADLMEGWSGPEAWGVWIDGRNAKLGISLSGAKVKTPLSLSVQCLAHTTVSNPEQQVAVTLDGQRVALWTWKFGAPDGDVNLRTLVIPAALIEGRERIVLFFDVSSPISPAATGASEDSRLLGFGLIQISF